jgi:heterotetrameric sarcosine oxidase gamma subunit
VSEYSLESASVLDEYKQQFNGAELRELIDIGKVSIAIPLKGEQEVEKALANLFGVAIPAVGKSVLSDDKMARVIRLGNDQLFVLLFEGQPDPRSVLAEKFGDAGYLTDQSDSWVGLEIRGTKARQALERICMIDLHPDVFLEDQIARTLMEHLGVLIIRNGDDSYILMSASSSAKSFLHAITTSIRNVE